MTSATYTTINLDPCSITVPHEVRDEEKGESLADSMREGGWIGRPLLVFATQRSFQAITGSHRIAAACSAMLESVPCVVISRESILAAGCKIIRSEEFDRYFIKDADGYKVTEYSEYAEVIKTLGNAEAAALLQEEIDHEEQD